MMSAAKIGRRQSSAKTSRETRRQLESALEASLRETFQTSDAIALIEPALAPPESGGRLDEHRVP